MKALQLHKFGPPNEAVELASLKEPEAPGPNDIVLSVAASPVNPSDLVQIRGYYGIRQSLPSVIGNEGVGRVTAVGSAVSGVAVGDIVIVKPGTPVWAERVRLPSESIFAVPPGDLLQRALLGINPATAFALLSEFGELKPGDWIIQNGATSAVGRWIAYLAAERALNVVNVVRSEEAAKRLSGEAHVFVDGPELSRNVRERIGKAQLSVGLERIDFRRLCICSF